MATPIQASLARTLGLCKSPRFIQKEYLLLPPTTSYLQCSRTEGRRDGGSDKWLGQRSKQAATFCTPSTVVTSRQYIESYSLVSAIRSRSRLRVEEGRGNVIEERKPSGPFSKEPRKRALICLLRQYYSKQRPTFQLRQAPFLLVQTFSTLCNRVHQRANLALVYTIQFLLPPIRFYSCLYVFTPARTRPYSFYSLLYTPRIICLITRRRILSTATSSLCPSL